LIFPWVKLEDDLETVDLEATEAILSGLGISIGSAMEEWWEMLNDIERDCFPHMDYYATALPNRRPALGFVRACLETDPRMLIGDLKQFFPLDRLELTMDTTEYDRYGITPAEWELDHWEQSWSIPVYPGMTAKELEEAIPRIIEQVQRYLGPRTVGARIENLRDNGLTQQEIAVRLGLDVKSVQAHLRFRNQIA
jgi:hypothetical protein